MKSNKLIITPLGTVSTYCTKNKNCPGYFIKYNKSKILLDCGNGISKYLKFPNDLNNLTIIISHLHSDHYGEILSLAQTSLVFNRLGLLEDKINVYIPKGDIEIDKDGNQKNLIDYDYLLSLEKESYFKFVPYNQNDSLLIEDLKISFNKNPHPIITYSVKIENEKVKVVYSSDTGYTGNCLEEFAKDANLLICESTFLEGQVRSKDYHLYAKEAGKIAKAANVEKLLLTHFWPSISKEEYVKQAKEEFANTEAAQENKSLIFD